MRRSEYQPTPRYTNSQVGTKHRAGQTGLLRKAIDETDRTTALGGLCLLAAIGMGATRQAEFLMIMESASSRSEAGGAEGELPAHRSPKSAAWWCTQSGGERQSVYRAVTERTGGSLGSSSDYGNSKVSD